MLRSITWYTWQLSYNEKKGCELLLSKTIISIALGKKLRPMYRESTTEGHLKIPRAAIHQVPWSFWPEKARELVEANTWTVQNMSFNRGHQRDCSDFWLVNAKRFLAVDEWYSFTSHLNRLYLFEKAVNYEIWIKFTFHPPGSTMKILDSNREECLYKICKITSAILWCVMEEIRNQYKYIIEDENGL